MSRRQYNTRRSLPDDLQRQEIIADDIKANPYSKNYGNNYKVVSRKAQMKSVGKAKENADTPLLPNDIFVAEESGGINPMEIVSEETRKVQSKSGTKGKKDGRAPLLPMQNNSDVDTGIYSRVGTKKTKRTHNVPVTEGNTFLNGLSPEDIIAVAKNAGINLMQIVDAPTTAKTMKAASKIIQSAVETPKSYITAPFIQNTGKGTNKNSTMDSKHKAGEQIVTVAEIHSSDSPVKFPDATTSFLMNYGNDSKQETRKEQTKSDTKGNVDRTLSLQDIIIAAKSADINPMQIVSAAIRAATIEADNVIPQRSLEIPKSAITAPLIQNTTEGANKYSIISAMDLKDKTEERIVTIAEKQSSDVPANIPDATSYPQMKNNEGIGKLNSAFPFGTDNLSAAGIVAAAADSGINPNDIIAAAKDMNPGGNGHAGGRKTFETGYRGKQKAVGSESFKYSWEARRNYKVTKHTQENDLVNEVKKIKDAIQNLEKKNGKSASKEEKPIPTMEQSILVQNENQRHKAFNLTSMHNLYACTGTSNKLPVAEPQPWQAMQPTMVPTVPAIWQSMPPMIPSYQLPAASPTWQHNLPITRFVNMPALPLAPQNVPPPLIWQNNFAPATSNRIPALLLPWQGGSPQLSSYEASMLQMVPNNATQQQNNVFIDALRRMQNQHQF